MAIGFTEEGKEERCCEEEGNCGMTRLCDWLVSSLCMLASMSWGHAGNICCLGAPGLTLKMRKNSTSREVLSLKWACHFVYSSAYWQVSRGPPNVEIYTQTEGAANKVLPAEIPLTEHNTPYASPPPKLDHFITLAWRRSIITCCTCTCGYACSCKCTLWSHNWAGTMGALTLEYTF